MKTWMLIVMVIILLALFYFLVFSDGTPTVGAPTSEMSTTTGITIPVDLPDTGNAKG